MTKNLSPPTFFEINTSSFQEMLLKTSFVKKLQPFFSIDNTNRRFLAIFFENGYDIFL